MVVICSPESSVLVDPVHQIRASLSSTASASRRYFAFLSPMVPFAPAFRPVRSSQIHHVLWCKPIDFGFFGDQILDRLQAAWAPSSCYLSSVSPKLMGCKLPFPQPGTAWAGVRVLSQVNLATAALTACNGYALTPECLFLMSFFHCFVFYALFSIRQS